MPNINDRIGSQNVIRVLSNASAPPTKLTNLTDVDSTLKTVDGMILVWDLSVEQFIMTSVIDSSSTTIEGIGYFTNTTDSTSTTTGALVVSGGVGVGKQLFVGETLDVTGISTFSSDLDINASVDVLNNMVVNGNLQLVGIATFTDTTDNVLGNADTGAVQLDGGLGVAKNVTVGAGLSITADLYVGGTSEFIGNATFRGGTIGIGDSTGDDINVSGEFISDLNPNEDGLYDLGIVGKRWRDARFSGLVTSTTLNVANTALISGISTFQQDVDVIGTFTAGLIDGGFY